MKTLAAIVAVLVIVVAVYSGGFVYDAFFVAPGPAAQEKILMIDQGDSVAEIARALDEGGVIKSAFPFKLYVKLAGKSDELQAGQFHLKTGMSYAAIVDALTKAKAQEVEVTIPEGYTVKQIGEAVRVAIPSITEEQWNTASADKEGYLFPDTYRFFADATAEDIVAKMQATLDQKAPGITHDQLTLASIIEREVQNPDDMKMIAGIFYNRLDAGMPLQADSTLTYVLGKTSAEMTTDDLKFDSPYNTYLYQGLPPGPISNPGMNAIDAVLHPTASDYYYFLTTEDGTVIYAKTFQEHVQNKRTHL